jgi:hypothetical protein
MAEINGARSVLNWTRAADTLEKLVFPASTVCMVAEMFTDEEMSANVIAPTGTPSGTGGRALTCKPVIVFER